MHRFLAIEKKELLFVIELGYLTSEGSDNNLDARI